MIQLSRLSPCCTRAEGDTSTGPKSSWSEQDTANGVPACASELLDRAAPRASSRGLHRLIAPYSQRLLGGDDAPFNGGTGEPFCPAETFVMHNCFVSEGTA
jgi:hypothetical protein